VLVDGEEGPSDGTVPHIELTRWADVMLVLPATANILGKAAHGIADDLVSTCIVAADCPVVFVPAMNEVMWRKPAVQPNVAAPAAEGTGARPAGGGMPWAGGQIGQGARPAFFPVRRETAAFLNAGAPRVSAIVAPARRGGVCP